MLLVTGHENKMIICVSTGAIANIVLNIILIPQYNHIGAAIACVVSELVVMIIYISFGKKYFRLNDVVKELSMVFICSIAMGVLIFVVGNLIQVIITKLMVQIVLGIISYFGFMYLLKEKIVREYTVKLLQKIHIGKSDL